MNKEHYIWFTSDLHLGHEKAATWRGFKDIREMCLLMKRKFYSVRFYIDVEHTIYHVGDFALGPDKKFWTSFLPWRSNIIYIKGNHDPKSLTNVTHQIINFKGHQIEIVHNPEDATGKFPIVIHGHIHKSGIRKMPNGAKKLNDYIYRKRGVTYYNVNCEFHKYKPKLLNEILGEIKHITKK